MSTAKIWIALIAVTVLFLGGMVLVVIGVMHHGASLCEQRYGVKVDGGSFVATRDGEVMILYAVKDSLFDCCGFSIWPYGKVSKWLRIEDHLIRNDK